MLSPTNLNPYHGSIHDDRGTTSVCNSLFCVNHGSVTVISLDNLSEFPEVVDIVIGVLSETIENEGVVLVDSKEIEERKD